MSNTIIIPQKGFWKHNHVITGFGTPYLTYSNGGGITDGIGRQHIRLYGVCDICNKKIQVAMMHVDKDGKLYGYDKK